MTEQLNGSRPTDAYLLIEDAGNLIGEGWAQVIAAPEFAPGMQLLDIQKDTYGRSDEDEIPGGKYVVFNCEFFIPVSSLELDRITTYFVPKPSYDAFVRSFNVHRVRKVGAIINPKISSTPRSTLCTAVSTTAGERYWRVSAFANDRRVTAARELLAFSYTTSDSDIAHVGSGLAAVGRYALPNPFPSVFAYSIEPNLGTRIDLGTVRPMFGQAGGGVEGVFQASTGPWTVANHVKTMPAW